MLGRDGEMDGWINVRTEKTSIPSPAHTVRKKEEKEKKRRAKCLPKP